MISFHFLAMVRNLQDFSWKGKTIFKGNMLKDGLALAKMAQKKKYTQSCNLQIRHMKGLDAVINS